MANAIDWLNWVSSECDIHAAQFCLGLINNYVFHDTQSLELRFTSLKKVPIREILGRNAILVKTTGIPEQKTCDSYREAP